MIKKVGIAGLGAIGSTVARALLKGIDGLHFYAASELNPRSDLKIPLVDFATLAKECDLIIECLPASIVPKLAEKVLENNTDMIVITSAALLIHPSILEQQRGSQSRIFVPSGALCGLDGVHALAQMGIKSARIASTKPPKGYTGAPYIVEQSIDLAAIKEKTKIFSGNALQAAKAFPANVNVAATLSLAGIGGKKTQVEIWADPVALGNTHEIRVEGEFSTISAKIENTPDPANPKSSMLAAQSIISVLKGMTEPLVIF